MRRFAIAAIALGAVLALAACSLPSGVDGNLVNNWTSMSVPQRSIPHVGDCRATNEPDLLQAIAVPCTGIHDVETVYVGAFVGSDAQRLTPPPGGSTVRKKTYSSCLAPAATYLGAPWYDGVVTLSVILPDEDAWQGGARWFMCDVSEAVGVGDTAIKDSTGSLHGALTPGKPLRLTCINWTETRDHLEDFTQAKCSARHTGEFVGVYTAPDIPYPSESKQDKLVENPCEDLVGKYLGFHGIADYASDTVGYAWQYTDQDRWEMGDRTIRCFANAFTKDKHFIGSVKGIRGKTANG